jgi:uncharacterized membrane protein HdeD (DUF308 family)
MNHASRLDHGAFSKNSSMFFVWGFLLLILGIAAISVAVLTTIISIVFIGALLMIGGAVVFFDGFVFWRRHLPTMFFMHLIVGLLYFLVGLMLVRNPLLASTTLTLILGVFYIGLGVFRMAYSSVMRMPHWVWTFFNGLICILLGAFIITSWPISGLYIIGLFVGIDLIFFASFYIASGFKARSLAK